MIITQQNRKPNCSSKIDWTGTSIKYLRTKIHLQIKEQTAKLNYMNEIISSIYDDPTEQRGQMDPLNGC